MKFIHKETILAIHEMLIAEHGGLSGVRDSSLLESALERPKNKFYYNPHITIYECAASYAYGIVKNHPFADGNKRTGAVSMALFLKKNGFDITMSEKEMVLYILALAEGSKSEQEIADWLKKNTKKCNYN